MSSVHVALGWVHLTDAEKSAIPALCRVCEALDLRTHWDQTGETLYIAPPLLGKKLAIAATAPGTDQESADRVAGALCRRLRRTGADPFPSHERPDAGGCDLILTVALGTAPAWSITVSQGWPPWHQSQRLATVLGKAIASRLEAAAPEPEVVIAPDRQPGPPSLSITLGMPPSGADDSWVEAVTSAIAEGLGRFWTPPSLEPLISRVAERAAEPLPPAPEPVPEAPGEEPTPAKEDPPEEPAVTAPEAEPPGSAEPAPRPRLELWSDGAHSQRQDGNAVPPQLLAPEPADTPRLWLESDPTPPRPRAEPRDSKEARLLGSPDAKQAPPAKPESRPQPAPTDEKSGPTHPHQTAPAERTPAPVPPVTPLVQRTRRPRPAAFPLLPQHPPGDSPVHVFPRLGSSPSASPTTTPRPASANPETASDVSPAEPQTPSGPGRRSAPSPLPPRRRPARVIQQGGAVIRLP